MACTSNPTIIEKQILILKKDGQMGGTIYIRFREGGGKETTKNIKTRMKDFKLKETNYLVA